jgi:hypothetical protein
VSGVIYGRLVWRTSQESCRQVASDPGFIVVSAFVGVSGSTNRFRCWIDSLLLITCLGGGRGTESPRQRKGNVKQEEKEKKNKKKTKHNVA